MTTDTGNSASAGAHPGPAPRLAVPTPFDGPVRDFTMRFSSTPRGARLARRLAAHRLDEWGLPYGADPHEDVALIVSELAVNAVRHGHVAGRDFRMRLAADGHRVQVGMTDTRGERAPFVRAGGHGLVLVDRLADAWGWAPRGDGPGKTVWAERALPGHRPGRGA